MGFDLFEKLGNSATVNESSAQSKLIPLISLKWEEVEDPLVGKGTANYRAEF